MRRAQTALHMQLLTYNCKRVGHIESHHLLLSVCRQCCLEMPKRNKPSASVRLSMRWLLPRSVTCLPWTSSHTAIQKAVHLVLVDALLLPSLLMQASLSCS